MGVCCRLFIPSFEPMSVNDWWYVSSYAVFLILLPFVFPALKSMGKNNHKKCCVVLFVLWGILALVPGSNLNNGLNVVGFEYVFVLISYYKWYMKEIPIHYAAWMVTLGAIVILIWNVVLPMLIPNNSRLLIDLLWPVEKEWSIPIMLISFGLFEIFRRMVFYSRIVNIIAASSFGVYLITEQPFIREQLWSKWVVLSGFYDSKYAVVQTYFICHYHMRSGGCS